MIVAIYLRVSSNAQEIGNQALQIKPYCEKNDYEVYKIYSDITCGADDTRPAFDQMFRDAHQRKFDLVIFWALDRFSRSGTLFTLQKLKELENLGIQWHSYQEPYFSTIGDFKDVVLSIMATLARIERQRISDRTKAGLARAKAKKGKLPVRGKDKRPRIRRNDRGRKRKCYLK